MITRRDISEDARPPPGCSPAHRGLAMPALAQGTRDQARLCQPADRPARRLRRGRQFIIDGFLAAAKAAGLNFEVIVKDSQSNPNRAAEVANELIVNDEINLMLVASTPETTNPVATTCEAEEMPCISTVAPWQPWFIGQQANPGRPGIAGSRSTTPTTSSGGSRTSSRSSPTCGPSSRPTRRSAGCSRMTATAMPGATKCRLPAGPRRRRASR